MKPEVEQSPWEMEKAVCGPGEILSIQTKAAWTTYLAEGLMAGLDRMVARWNLFRSEAFIDRTGRHG